MKYRKEIDGLRAVAVLPVLFFHADFNFFSGGFLGVDVFFVISGFLITSILLKDISQHRFSLLYFYERRARRIMPALLFMGLGTLVFAYVAMPRHLFKDFGMSLANVYTFTSNIYFQLTSGYFSTVADQKPLLHTWSLAVEEQYYLFFPLLLLLLYKRVNKHVLNIIVVLLVLSLLTSHFLTQAGYNNASFYLITSRAWELFAGSVLAFTQISTFSKNSVIRESMGVLGLLMLLVSFVVFDKDDSLPGFYSLIPVVGTMLIIVFATSTTYVGKLLAQKWLVFTGLISYSLYLWHQPILAFLKLKTVGHPSAVALSLGLAVSFCIAIISWKYIEAPFRDKAKTSSKFVFTFSVVGIMLSITAGLYIHQNKGLPDRFSNQLEYSDIGYSPKRKACHTAGTDYLKPSEACRYFEGNEVTWAVLGDSHGVELAYALATELQEKNEAVLHLTNSACPAAAFMKLRSPKGCGNWSRDAIETLVNDKKIDKVVIIYRHSLHYFGDHLSSYPELPQKNRINFVDKSKRKEHRNNIREYYWNSYRKTVETLVQANKKVFVVYPVPELPLSIKNMIAPVTIFSEKPTLNPVKAVSLEYYNRRNRYVLNKLNTLNYGENLFAVKPDEIFCDELFCSAAKNNRSYYADDDHLSVFGASKLATEIIMRNDQKK